VSALNLSDRLRGVSLIDSATGQQLEQQGKPLQGRSAVVQDIHNATRLPFELAGIIEAYAKDSATELLLKLTFIGFVAPQLQTDIRARAAAWPPTDTQTMDYGAARIDINCGFIPLRGEESVCHDIVRRGTSFLGREGEEVTGVLDVRSSNIFPLLAKRVHELYYPKATALVNPHGQSHTYFRTDGGTRFDALPTEAMRCIEVENVFSLEGCDRRHEGIAGVRVVACPVNSSIEDIEEDASSKARNGWIATATDKEPHYLVTVDLQPVKPTGRLVSGRWCNDDGTMRQVNEMELDETKSPSIRITCHIGKENPLVVLESRITQLPELLPEVPLPT